MQIVINGDNWHEMSNPDFWGHKNITKLLSAELAQSGKGYFPWQKWPMAPLRHFSYRPFSWTNKRNI